jgi:hypothetical protein
VCVVDRAFLTLRGAVMGVLPDGPRVETPATAGTAEEGNAATA